MALTLLGWVLNIGTISKMSRLLFWITAAAFILYNLYTFINKLKPAFSK
ncbi:MAG: hypothetical protein PHD41_01285 [Methanosarcinaceae archaeon]|nr:hypothetical protein [Methanosarcinaceae archaeon]MDD4331000.1 hypothetical protein [Methanosarcinaceae archaeon]MDD4748515.1 hypothetical protein [Methanosarcinaceae archaeon]